MEKDLFKQLHTAAKKAALDPAKKALFREHLLKFMASHPVSASVVARHIDGSEKQQSFFFSLIRIARTRQLTFIQGMAIILIFALVAGCGTSFAAEHALPGDVLYPVKIEFNEQVRGLVSFSNEARAEWDVWRAERRLEEATELAVHGELNAEVRAEIENSFKSHSDKAQERLERSDDDVKAVSVSSDFETVLRVRERVLVGISAQAATSSKSEVDKLLIEVHDRVEKIGQTRVEAEGKASLDVNVATGTAAQGHLKAAEKKVAEVTRFLASMKNKVQAGVYADAEAKLALASDTVIRGKANIEAKEYGQAFTTFQEAMRTAQEAKLIVATAHEAEIEMEVPEKQ